MNKDLKKASDSVDTELSDKNKRSKIVCALDKVKIPFLLFMIYSILGWIMEVIIFLANEHRFINRGFLIGPYCSIYGFGCLIITYGLKKYRKEPIKLFFISTILCSIIEYLTSYVMEVLFGGRWWDYTLNILNINGRVWFVTSVLFGFLVCLIIYYLRPFLIKCIRKIPRKVISGLVSVLLLIYIVDNIISFTAVINLKDKFKSFEQDCTSQVSEYIMQKIKDVIK